MGGFSLGIAIELLVAVLLAVTIGYCVLVNQKLVQLRSDQSELKMIVRDLHAATNQAELAIAGLRQSAQTAEQSLGGQLEMVRSLDEQLTGSIGQGEVLLTKLTTVTRAYQARSSAASRAAPKPQPILQSEIGLGKLNAQRQDKNDIREDELLQDEVAA
jgi:hypothetical protein